MYVARSILGKPTAWRRRRLDRVLYKLHNRIAIHFLQISPKVFILFIIYYLFSSALNSLNILFPFHNTQKKGYLSCLSQKQKKGRQTTLEEEDDDDNDDNK